MSELLFRIEGLKLILGGFLIFGLAISQAVYGWMGQSILMRYIYPVALCIVGALFIGGGAIAAFMRHDDAAAEGKQSESRVNE